MRVPCTPDVTAGDPAHLPRSFPSPLLLCPIPPTPSRGLKVPKGSHTCLWPGPALPTFPLLDPLPPCPAQSPSLPPPPGREPHASPVSPSPASRLLPPAWPCLSTSPSPSLGVYMEDHVIGLRGGLWPAGPCPQHPAEGGTWWLLHKIEQKSRRNVERNSCSGVGWVGVGWRVHESWVSWLRKFAGDRCTDARPPRPRLRTCLLRWEAAAEAAYFCLSWSRWRLGHI